MSIDLFRKMSADGAWVNPDFDPKTSATPEDIAKQKAWEADKALKTRATTQLDDYVTRQEAAAKAKTQQATTALDQYVDGKPPVPNHDQTQAIGLNEQLGKTEQQLVDANKRNAQLSADKGNLEGDLKNSKGRESWAGAWQDTKDWANKPNFTGLNNWQTGAAGLGLGVGAYALYKMLGKKKKQRKTASHVLHSMLRKEAGFGRFLAKWFTPKGLAGAAAKRLEAGRFKAAPIAPIATSPKPAGFGERSLDAMGKTHWTNAAPPLAAGAGYVAHKGLQSAYGPNAADKQILADAAVGGPTSGAWWNTDNRHIGSLKPWQAAAGIGAAGIGAYALAKLLHGDDE